LFTTVLSNENSKSIELPAAVAATTGHVVVLVVGKET